MMTHSCVVNGNGYYSVTVNGVKPFFRNGAKFLATESGRPGFLTGLESTAELFRGNADLIGLAVALDRELDEISLALLFLVGYVGYHRVVLISGAEISMELIDGLDARQLP